MYKIRYKSEYVSVNTAGCKSILGGHSCSRTFGNGLPHTEIPGDDTIHPTKPEPDAPRPDPSNWCPRMPRVTPMPPNTEQRRQSGLKDLLWKYLTFVGEMCACTSTHTSWEILKLKLFELHGKSTSASGQEDQNQAVAIKKINGIFRKKVPLGCSYLLGMASKAHRINLSFWLRHRSSTRRVFILWAVSLRNQSAFIKKSVEKK